MKVYKNDGREPSFTCYSYNEKRGDIHGDYNHIYFECEYKPLMLIHDESDERLYWQGFFDAMESLNDELSRCMSYEALKKMTRARVAQMDNPQHIEFTNED